ncbi:MAG: tetratricopeptide repeat protein [Acidobacteria bacterium]|nr:tetratricopeptide repeat protein [Acidobacteriota bacterium]
MRRFSTPSLTVLLCLLLCAAPSFAQGVGPGSAAVSQAEAEKWREDLRYMAREMELRHKNLFHTMTREQFETAVRRLDERIPSLARHQIVVELMRIVALVGDGHTNLSPTRDPKVGFRTLPVKLYLFKDGMFVRAAERGHADLLGARVVQIGDLEVEEAVARAREVVGRDNEMDVRFYAPLLLAMPEVLHALGLSESPEAARFTFEKGGRRQTSTLKPAGPFEMLPPDSDLSWLPKEGWVDMRDGAATPLWLKDPKNKFWFEQLPNSKVVYAQVNEVNDKPDETLADFSKRLLSFVEANDVDRLVLDLRLDRGGNGGLLKPFVLGLIKSKINRRGHLFVLMGRSTWSAAQFFLNRLEEYTDVVFVGEPSGSKGNAYGDSRRITLPNSQLTARVSVYYWQDWHPRDARQWTAPDVTAELSSEDYRAGLDPALKAALAYAPRKPLGQVLDEALTEGGAELALKRFREFRADYVNKYAETEEPLLVAGERMLDEKKPEQALALFKLDAEENPQSPRALYAVGVAHFRLGNKEQASKSLEKALELDPKFYEAADLLGQLKRP